MVAVAGEVLSIVVGAAGEMAGEAAVLSMSTPGAMVGGMGAVFTIVVGLMGAVLLTVGNYARLDSYYVGW